MSKKNRKPNRVEFLDMIEDGTVEKGPTFGESTFEEIVKPKYSPARLKPEDAGIYREGMVVTCPNTSQLRPEAVVTGTIVQLCAGEAWVVDDRGLMHKVPVSKIYLAQ